MPEQPRYEQIKHEQQREAGAGEQHELSPERVGDIPQRYEQQPESDVSGQQSGTQVSTQPSQRAISPELLAIENILADGMEDFFRHLSPQKQQEFKATGEAAAEKILTALHSKTTRIKDIVLLILNWLKTLPGINRFFLEQEAKIKADRIMQRYRR